MTVRCAIELQSGIVQLTVLCVGCWGELLEHVRLERKNIRSWSREMGTGGAYCEFCSDEAKREAL